MRSERFKIEKKERERQRGEMMSCRRRSFMNLSRVCSFTGVKSKISNIKQRNCVSTHTHTHTRACSLQFFPLFAREIFSLRPTFFRARPRNHRALLDDHEESNARNNSPRLPLHLLHLLLVFATTRARNSHRQNVRTRNAIIDGTDEREVGHLLRHLSVVESLLNADAESEFDEVG